MGKHPLRRIGLLLLAVTLCIPAITASGAEETWQEEYERICGQTTMAVELPTKQLESLARESDALLQNIKENPIGKNKVFLFRLTKCRDFFQYLLETKQESQVP